MGVTSMLALRARDWSANGIAHSKNAQQARQHAGALGWRLTPEEHAYQAGRGRLT